MAWSIRLSRAINADTAQVMGRGTGIGKLRIVQDVENRQRWVFATVLAGGVGFGVGNDEIGGRRSVPHTLTW